MIRSASIACTVLLAGVCAAQTSELVLTSYASTDAFVVRNGQVIRQFARTSQNDGPAFCVNTSIKMFGQFANAIGREYDVNGNLLAGQYPNGGFVDCYDGATNGALNWTISHNDFSNNFAVLVGDSNWGNMQVAFVPTRRSSGITYDATDNTLWVANNVGGCDNVQHYTLTGTLLGEFPVGLQSGGGYGIALDPADQTLWLPGAFGTFSQLHQYSKAGALLQIVTVPGITSNTLGAEFIGGPSVNSFCTPGTTTHGCLPAISGSGTASATAASGFTILVQGVEGQKSGIVFYGVNNAGFIPLPWGPSSSFLCVKPPTQRTLPQSSGGTVNLCDGSLSIDWNAFRAANPGALGAPFSAGQHIYAQGWFRDPPSPKNTMLSDALDFTLAP